MLGKNAYDASGAADDAAAKQVVLHKMFLVILSVNHSRNIFCKTSLSAAEAEIILQKTEIMQKFLCGYYPCMILCYETDACEDFMRWFLCSGFYAAEKCLRSNTPAGCGGFNRFAHSAGPGTVAEILCCCLIV